MSNTATCIRRSTKRAIEKYGIEICIDAFTLHAEGNGASTIAWSFAVLNGNTNASNAAINAGRDLAGLPRIS